ncbi:Urea active transporter [Cyberlindnera fabianii]|uniref:Urea active transporter n=1 Tax=Cyberlindnera fabianii TaxID=36022 RepID=A0A1V2KZU2_CYBFA|nr:Urea active transporter [Cyberlindnera fabianii]
MLDGPPLPQGAGYAMVCGLGAVFSIGMMLITTMLKRYQKEIMTAEEFATAGRSVKTSLIAAAVVSSWTWAATLLTSTTQAYLNGVSGGFWYGAGACVQVILFATLAIKAKQVAPEAHTFLEIIKGRYGTVGHAVYMYYGIATNILVTAMLLTGASATVSFLTGMNTIAAIFLLPLGIVAYILYGGIKSVFLTDYIHTIVIIVILLMFAFEVYAVNPLLGSPGAVWDKLTELAETKPISGNAQGSYLTFKSHNGGIFLIINLCGNFAAVFMDNGYWQKAISASPASALPGYVLGGLGWIAIPVVVSTTMGLACRALESSPSFPYYPGLSADQVDAGLVLPATAYTLLGTGGAVASLLLVFMAFTSAMSAEVISVSSIATYDIYRSYINPNATGKQLMWTNYISVCGFTLAMVGFGIGLYESEVSLGFLYNFMGVIIASAVIPATLTLFWSRQTLLAATVSPIIGSIVAIIGWISAAKGLYGTVTYDNLFMDNVMLTGNLLALIVPGIFSPLLSFIFPEPPFDFETLKTGIHRVDETEEIMEAEGELPEGGISPNTDPEKLAPITSVATIGKRLAAVNKAKLLEEESAHLAKASRFAGWLTLFLFLALIIVWPMPMFGTGYIFSKRFFTGWITVWIGWLFLTAFLVCLFPLWEGRHGIYTTVRGIYWDLSGQSYKLREWQNEHPEQLHVVQSQISAAIHSGNGNVVTTEDKIGNIDAELSSDEHK